MSRQNFDEVAGFVRRTIDSVGQLEILLLLHSLRGEPRTAAQINDALRSNLPLVHNRLAGLQSRGLVALQGEGEQRLYRFAPANDQLRHSVDILSIVYQEYRGRIIDLIFSPKDRLRDFSDAFRLKEEDDDA